MHLCVCELFLNYKITRVCQADVEWRAVCSQFVAVRVEAALKVFQ